MAKTDAIAELFYSNKWNDITADVFTRDPISITRGRPDESQRIPPSTLNLTLDNRTGKYSPRNPTSALYGLIGRNTPIRVAVELAKDTWTRTTSNNWGTSDSGNLWLDSSTAFSATGTLGRITHNATTSFFNRLNNTNGITDCVAQCTMRIGTKLTGTGAVYSQMLLRFQDSANYYTAGLFYQASGTPTGSVGVVLAKIVGGSQTNLFANFSFDVYNGSETFNLKSEVVGSTVRIKVWRTTVAEPLAWTAEVTDTAFASGSFAVLSRKDSTITSVDPTIDYDNLSVKAFRFTGEVESWPQKWSVDGNNVWAPITANGILRRLNAPGTTRASISSLRRDIMDSAQPAPVAYWPLEEGKGSAFPMPYNGLGLPGIVNFADAYQPGQDGGPAGCMYVSGITAKTVLGSTGPRFGQGITLPVPPHAGGVEIVTLHVRSRPFDSAQKLDGATFNETNHRVEFAGGGIRAMRIYLQASASSAANVNIFFWDPTFTLLGTPDTLISTIPLHDGNWHEIQVRMVQSGGNISTELWADGALAATSTITAVTLGSISNVVLGCSSIYDTGLVVGQVLQGPFQVSHVTVHNNSSVGQFYQATIGHAGETAADRITRLCNQDGIPVTISGVAASSEPLGEQRVAPLLELLQDAADADGGHLFEAREFLGLTYRTFKSLYNQTSTVDLSYSAGSEVAPPLEPVEDTDATGNDISVTRYQGGFANVVQDTGPLNVAEPPTGVGRYRKDITLVLADDSQCLQQAAWLKHLGTWDEARFPVVNLDLTAMMDAGKVNLSNLVGNLDIGDRFTIAGQPSWLPPDTVELRAQGFREVLESHHWMIAVNATPALPYNVGILDSSTWGRLDSSDTTLNGALTTTATSVPVTSVSVPWIDSAAFASSFPFDVMVAGERMTVTAITGTGLSQTFTVTRSVNGVVKAQASGTLVRLFRPLRLAR